MQKILVEIVGYLILAPLYAIGILPLKFQYLLSNVFVYLPLRLIGYRRKIILGNISSAFPTMSLRAVKNTAKTFYHFLADVLAESLWLFAVGEKRARKHCTIENAQILSGYCGKSVIIVLGHYGNWEYLKFWADINLDSAIAPYPHNVAVIYKAPRTELSHLLTVKMRQPRDTQWTPARDAHGNVKRSLILVEHKEAAMFMFKHRHEEWLYFFIADQSPKPGAKFHTQFLNHDTFFFNGPEVLARKFHLPVLYYVHNRVKRGVYSCSFTPITDNPDKIEEGYITKRFAQLLEADITNQPAFWLWSHKRWYRKLEKMYAAIGETYQNNY